MLHSRLLCYRCWAMALQSGAAIRAALCFLQKDVETHLPVSKPSGLLPAYCWHGSC